MRSKGRMLKMAVLTGLMFMWCAAAWAAPQVSLKTPTPKAGETLEITGQIAPGEELYLVVSSSKLFKASDSLGSEEATKLGKKFGDTEIPPVFYALTSNPAALATPKTVSKGQWFAPFRWDVEVNKINPWESIPEEVKSKLGSVSTAAQWKFLTFTHEDKFGINTISKERPVGGGNARMIMGDDPAKSWNKDASVTLDKTTGQFTASFKVSKIIAPDTILDVFVNGEKVGETSIQKRGFYFRIGGTYMNPLVVFLGAVLIGCMFVIVGAAGGLFTAAFQITLIGTQGMVGVNAANAVKPTNLFLSLCSPITGVYSYFKEGRFAWPVALFFVAGILLGAFWIGPTYSAKYLPMKAYKFYLGFFCLLLFIKLWYESTQKSINKNKAVKAIVKKFDVEMAAAKKEGRAANMGKVVLEKGWNATNIHFSFWGEAFHANPIALFFGGIVIGCIASAFGVGGGFMLVPFMTTIMGYPMYLAVPISLCGTFGTSVGGISRYILSGYSPDWIMAALIAVGSIIGGKIGPKIQKKLPEIFLKRALALILLIVFLKYTNAIPFLR
ncbi:sulfite exporter TauE/SafE family protein [Desulfoluna sp.]|uniref:sulfite exporter TauE/SafE family protein n=1 Tax=Desulfoluna sp. TaxID=2045199 RepID=UPI002616CD2E|nr:sulfite exporter TauE/SafE family protein [Desulfoluna sp.]